MVTAQIAKPEYLPTPDDPKKNLRNWCLAVGLDERKFVALPDEPSVFVGKLDLDDELCGAIEIVSQLHGAHNRTVRPKAVKFHRHQMDTGAHVFTGQPIIISEKWIQLDGHHRIAGGKQTKKRWPTQITFGILDKYFPIIDNSIGRNLADNMELYGAGRHAWLAHAINMLLAADLHDGNPLAKLDFSISPKERGEFYLSHPELKLAAESALAIESVCPVSLGETTYVLYIAHKANAEKTRSFVERVVSGVDLSAADPRLAFTKWIVRQAQNTGRKAPKSRVKLIALLKAMKCHIDDVPLPFLVVNKGEALPTLE